MTSLASSLQEQCVPLTGPWGTKFRLKWVKKGLNKAIPRQEKEEFGWPSVTLTQRKGLDTPGGRCDLAGDLPSETVRTLLQALEANCYLELELQKLRPHVSLLVALQLQPTALCFVQYAFLVVRVRVHCTLCTPDHHARHFSPGTSNGPTSL